MGCLSFFDLTGGTGARAGWSGDTLHLAESATVMDGDFADLEELWGERADKVLHIVSRFAAIAPFEIEKALTIDSSPIIARAAIAHAVRSGRICVVGEMLCLPNQKEKRSMDDEWVETAVACGLLDISKQRLHQIADQITWRPRAEGSNRKEWSKASLLKYRLNRGYGERTRIAKRRTDEVLVTDVPMPETAGCVTDSTMTEFEAAENSVSDIVSDPPLTPLVSLERKIKAAVEAVECGLVSYADAWRIIKECVQ